MPYFVPERQFSYAPSKHVPSVLPKWVGVEQLHESFCNCTITCTVGMKRLRGVHFMKKL